MYKRIFLTLMTTLVVCQSATAGFFRKQDPKEQLRTAINASSYSNFATTFKQNYQPRLNDALSEVEIQQLIFAPREALQEGELPPTCLSAKFDFLTIKDKISKANEDKLTELKKEKNRNYNIWMMTKGFAASAASVLGLKAWFIDVKNWDPRYYSLASHFSDVRYYWDASDTVVTAAGLCLGAYGAKWLYNGINYKNYIKNKIDQNEQIKQLIETTKDQ